MGRRPQMLEGLCVTNEDVEESKSGVHNVAMMARSDAPGGKKKNSKRSRAPLQQIRQSMIRQANMPASSDGFAK